MIKIIYKTLLSRDCGNRKIVKKLMSFYKFNLLTIGIF